MNIYSAHIKKLKEKIEIQEKMLACVRLENERLKEKAVKLGESSCDCQKLLEESQKTIKALVKLVLGENQE